MKISLQRISKFLMFVWVSSVSAQITLTPDTSQHFQTITGWEATAQAWALLESNSTGQSNVNPFFAGFKDELFDHLVDTLGVNRLRVELLSGCENPTDYFTQYKNGQITFNQYKASWYNIINDNSSSSSVNQSGFNFSYVDWQMDNYVLPVKQRVEANGEKFVFNLCYVDFQSSTFEHYSDGNEYAEFVTEAYKHIKSKYGFAPDFLEMVLEPDNTPWTGSLIGDAMVASITKLEAAGFSPKFIAPSVTNMNNTVSFFNAIATKMGSANVSKYIEEISYHLYGGASTNLRQSVASKAAQYGIRTSQLEFIGANQNDIHGDLSEANTSAWAQYTIGYNLNGWDVDDGSKYFMIDDIRYPSNPKIITASRTMYLRQYMKYIKQGAVRRSITSSNVNLEPLLFINPDGSYVIIVKTYAAQTFTINNLPAGNYGVCYTTANEYHTKKSDKAVSGPGTLSTSIPAAGIITIFGKPSITTGINNHLSTTSTAMVFPNPSSDVLKIQLQDPASRLEVFNVFGQKVKEMNSASGIVEINEAKDWGAGTYLIKIQSDSQIQTIKWIKK